MRRILLGLAIFAILSPAQETTGAILGKVFDATGAAISGAEVTASQTETGLTRKTKSASDGSYAFNSMPIGPYQIAASHAGFKRSIAGLQLHVSEHLGHDVRLQVGDVTQEVSVFANADAVRTESPEQGGLISGEQIRELQLNGRSFFTLLELIPGVSSNLSDRTDPNSTPDLSINGARNSASNISIDGGNNADVIVGSGSMNTFTSIETISEVSVVTTPFSAEYGRGGYSQINVVTRGGTKRYRGGLLYYVRNDFFDATDYFSHRTLPLRQNQFGYNLGGPLMFPGYNRKRQKTFFFFAQEFNRIVANGEATNTTVPNAFERTGDFSRLGPGRDGVFETADDPIVDPLTGVGFPGGKIPAERIDANSRKLISLYPLPNFVGPGNINFTSAAPSRQNWHEEMIRIDHNFSHRFSIYGRYAQDGLTLYNPYGGTSLSSVTTTFPGVAVTDGIRPGKNFVLNGTHTAGPTFLQQFQFTFARRVTDVHSASPNANRKTLGLTLPELFPENDGDVIPAISMTNYATLSPFHVAHKELFNMEFSDSFTKILNKHTVKFGAYYTYGGNLEQPSNVNTGGSFSFTTGFSKNPIANFLLGLPNTYTEVERPVLSDVRFAGFEAYILDEFRPFKQLTLNYGLRYTSYFNPYDLYKVATNFIPSLYDRSKAPEVIRANGTVTPGTGTPLNGIVVAGKNSPFGDRITNDLNGLFSPRFGFALASRKRNMSVRGGWGMYYTRPLIGTFINNAFNNPPFSRTVVLNQPSYSSLGGTESPTSAPALTTLGLPLKTPTIHQFSLGVEREVLRGHILNVAYVGSHGVRLMRPLTINDPVPGTLPTGTNVNFIRPYQGYGTISERQSSGSSIYHSLQVTYRVRMTRRLSGGIVYTWAKSIDDGSSDRDGTDVPPDSRSARAERGPSNFDRTHVLTGNFILQLPAPLRSTFFRGWQLSGISRMWTGRPFDVTMSADVAQIGAVQNQRPDVIADTRGPRTVEQWFNINAFARPRTGTFGSLGRNSFRYPGVNKWDLALFKTFKVAEGKTMQFRGEFFNAFNHPSFTTVGITLNTSATTVNPLINSFGVITGTRDARVAQIALKIYY
ncbi:MAG: TonB-dependent receptor [Candidatus Solibacter usitatus]|nr:TonB-dependent receptor [Candidatus Solibacter usitatus]